MSELTPEERSLTPVEEEGRAAQYSRLVSRVVRQFFLRGGDQDDLYQEGMIGLLNAIRSYDPARSDNFEAYASLCIRRQIIDAVRRDASSPSGRKMCCARSHLTRLWPGTETRRPNVWQTKPKQRLKLPCMAFFLRLKRLSWIPILRAIR